jgi:predicted amidohydrolase
MPQNTNCEPPTDLEPWQSSRYVPVRCHETRKMPMHRDIIPVYCDGDIITHFHWHRGASSANGSKQVVIQANNMQTWAGFIQTISQTHAR